MQRNPLPPSVHSTPLLLPIQNTIDEATDVKSFFFDYPLKARPGQFVMLWLPGVDQKPISISYQSKKQFGVTVARVGPFTSRLFSARLGEYVGITGPYGAPFDIPHDTASYHLILVGGGCGVAPLAFFADVADQRGIKVDFIIGAQTKDRLLFLDRFINNKGTRERAPAAIHPHGEAVRNKGVHLTIPLQRARNRQGPHPEV